jgi:glycosyltransferase involved in cell wall biosynthesis
MIQKDNDKKYLSFSFEFNPSFSNKKDYPKISIITPSYNQGPFIEETIRSVICQDYPNIEYIIIDGGSKDGSVDIIRKYESQLSYWVSESDKGQTNAINKGLIQAKGEIIAYLNSDDLYTPDAIRTAADFFKTHPDIDMIYGDIIHIDQHSEFINLHKTGKILLENYLSCEVYLPQPTVFFRKRVIEKIGYFDDTLNLAMDLDYWITIFLYFQTEYIPDTLAKARIYPAAKSSAEKLKYLRERLYILDKTFSNEDLMKSYFKSDEKVKELKNKTYSTVHFFGGLEYLKNRQWNIALHHIMKGIKLYPRHFLNPDLYWSIFVGILGKRISKKITGFIPERVKTVALSKYYLEELVK